MSSDLKKSSTTGRQISYIYYKLHWL